jgi:hypothetical protein
MANEFIARNGLIALDNSTVTGSLTVTGGITGSLLGTSSYALTASFALNSGGGGVAFPFTGSARITGSLIVTGSIISTTGITGSLFGTSSLSSTSSITILQNNILTNQTVGGLSSGTNLPSGSSIETILRTILITYIPPTLSSLAVRNDSSIISTAARDVGDSFTINAALFDATADNPTSIFPLSASFTGSNADVGTITYFFGNNVLSTSNELIIGGLYTINRATSAGSVTFTVNGRRSDTNALISGTSTSIAFQFRNYLAASSTVVSDNATAQTVVNAAVQSVLDSDRAWTATCTSANDTLGNFTYIIYPASYGDLTSIIQNGATPVLSAFTKIGDYTITNTFGSSISVRVYKSNADKAFADGTTLAIS